MEIGTVASMQLLGSFAHLVHAVSLMWLTWQLLQFLPYHSKRLNQLHGSLLCISAWISVVKVLSNTMPDVLPVKHVLMTTLATGVPVALVPPLFVSGKLLRLADADPFKLTHLTSYRLLANLMTSRSRKMVRGDEDYVCWQRPASPHLVSASFRHVFVLVAFSVQGTPLDSRSKQTVRHMLMRAVEKYNNNPLPCLWAAGFFQQHYNTLAMQCRMFKLAKQRSRALDIWYAVEKGSARLVQRSTNAGGATRNMDVVQLRNDQAEFFAFSVKFWTAMCEPRVNLQRLDSFCQPLASAATRCYETFSAIMDSADSPVEVRRAFLLCTLPRRPWSPPSPAPRMSCFTQWKLRAAQFLQDSRMDEERGKQLLDSTVAAYSMRPTEDNVEEPLFGSAAPLVGSADGLTGTVIISLDEDEVGLVQAVNDITPLLLDVHRGLLVGSLAYSHFPEPVAAFVEDEIQQLAASGEDGFLLENPLYLPVLDGSGTCVTAAVSAEELPPAEIGGSARLQLLLRAPDSPEGCYALVIMDPFPAVVAASADFCAAVNLDPAVVAADGFPLGAVLPAITKLLVQSRTAHTEPTCIREARLGNIVFSARSCPLASCAPFVQLHLYEAEPGQEPMRLLSNSGAGEQSVSPAPLVVVVGVACVWSEVVCALNFYARMPSPQHPLFYSHSSTPPSPLLTWQYNPMVPSNGGWPQAEMMSLSPHRSGMGSVVVPDPIAPPSAAPGAHLLVGAMLAAGLLDAMRTFLPQSGATRASPIQGAESPHPAAVEATPQSVNRAPLRALALAALSVTGGATVGSIVQPARRKSSLKQGTVIRGSDTDDSDDGGGRHGRESATVMGPLAGFTKKRASGGDTTADATANIGCGADAAPADGGVAAEPAAPIAGPNCTTGFTTAAASTASAGAACTAATVAPAGIIVAPAAPASDAPAGSTAAGGVNAPVMVDDTARRTLRMSSLIGHAGDLDGFSNSESSKALAVAEVAPAASRSESTAFKGWGARSTRTLMWHGTAKTAHTDSINVGASASGSASISSADDEDEAASTVMPLRGSDLGSKLRMTVKLDAAGVTNANMLSEARRRIFQARRLVEPAARRAITVMRWSKNMIVLAVVLACAWMAVGSCHGSCARHETASRALMVATQNSFLWANYHAAPAAFNLSFPASAVPGLLDTVADTDASGIWPAESVAPCTGFDGYPLSAYGVPSNTSCLRTCVQAYIDTLLQLNATLAAATVLSPRSVEHLLPLRSAILLACRKWFGHSSNSQVMDSQVVVAALNVGLALLFIAVAAMAIATVSALTVMAKHHRKLLQAWGSVDVPASASMLQATQLKHMARQWDVEGSSDPKDAIAGLDGPQTLQPVDNDKATASSAVGNRPVEANLSFFVHHGRALVPPVTVLLVAMVIWYLWMSAPIDTVFVAAEAAEDLLISMTETHTFTLLLTTIAPAKSVACAAFGAQCGTGATPTMTLQVVPPNGVDFDAQFAPTITPLLPQAMLQASVGLSREAAHQFTASTWPRRNPVPAALEHMVEVDLCGLPGSPGHAQCASGADHEFRDGQPLQMSVLSLATAVFGAVLPDADCMVCPLSDAPFAVSPSNVAFYVEQLHRFPTGAAQLQRLADEAKAAGRTARARDSNSSLLGAAMLIVTTSAVAAWGIIQLRRASMCVHGARMMMLFVSDKTIVQQESLMAALRAEVHWLRRNVQETAINDKQPLALRCCTWCGRRAKLWCTHRPARIHERYGP